MIRLLLVDDHAVVRAGLSKIFDGEHDITVVGEASDGRQAITKVLALRPDVVLMDIYMVRSNGLEALQEIKQRLPNTKVIMLTVSENEKDLFEAVRLGADGYVLKSASVFGIAEAVRQAVEGQATLSPEVASKVLREFRKEQFSDLALSARELQVLTLVGAGLTNKEIAQRLVITAGSAKTYLQRIMQKLHLKNRAEAVAYAVKHGLTEPKTGA